MTEYLQIHYADVSASEKPDWFMYELFGGGREVRVVARREKERRKKIQEPAIPKTEIEIEKKNGEEEEGSKYARYRQDLTGDIHFFFFVYSLRSLEDLINFSRGVFISKIIGDEYNLLTGMPPTLILSSASKQALREAHPEHSWLDGFFSRSIAEQQILREIDEIYDCFLDFDEMCCHIYHTENCCWERSIGYDLESVLEIALADVSWIDSDYSQRLCEILFIHLLNYMHVQKNAWRVNTCAPGVVSHDIFTSIALKALQDNAEEALGTICFGFRSFIPYVHCLFCLD